MLTSPIKVNHARVKGGWKALTNNFHKKSDNRAHSKSSNSSGFNPILQKFYKMICEIIFSKTVCGILIFCRLSFINYFMVMNSFSEPKNQRKLNISRPVYFKKISAHRFVGLICTNKLEGFFFRKFFFQRLGAFFTTATRLIWASFFSTKK